MSTSASDLKFMAFVSAWPQASDTPVFDYGAATVIDLYLIVQDPGPGSYYLLKNGSAITLNGSSPQLHGIAVHGGHVYVAGTYMSSGEADPCYWKDGGDPIQLAVSTGTSAAARAIAVDSTGLVYVAGENDNSHACYWTNNGTTTTEHVLNSGSNASIAQSIFVDGTSVYAGGYVNTNDVTWGWYNRATTWKYNGSLSETAIGYVPTGTGGGSNHDSYVYAIGYDGSHVLAVGTQMPAAGSSAAGLPSAWQDSAISYNFTDQIFGPNSSVGWSSFFSGATLYIPGYLVGGVIDAAFWQVSSGSSAPTESATSLHSNSYMNSTYAYATCAAGGDVYVCGNDMYRGPVVWINDGTKQKQITGYSSAAGAYGIAVDVR